MKSTIPTRDTVAPADRAEHARDLVIPSPSEEKAEAPIKAWLVGEGEPAALLHALEQHPKIKTLFSRVEGEEMLGAQRELLEEIDLLMLDAPQKRAQTASLLEQSLRQGTRILELQASPFSAGEYTRVSGVTELTRDALPEADWVVVPGPLSISLGIALAPLAEEGVLADQVQMRDCTRSVSEPLDESFDPWASTLELAELLDEESPHLLFPSPPKRLLRGFRLGLTLRVDLHPRTVHELYYQHFAEELFVQVLPWGANARAANVLGTHVAELSLHRSSQPQHIHILVAIDAFARGRTGQALQNINAMFGLSEGTGLSPLALNP